MPSDHPMWADLLVRAFRKESPAALAIWLAELPIFAGFPHRENLHIARLIHRREYASGETVFKQGDIGSGMYLIESGAVRIVGEDIRHGEVQYAILRAGQSFGEMSLFDNAPRSASAVAAEETVLYGLFEGDLDQLERTRPHVACKLLRNLGQLVAVRLRHTNDRLREIEDSRLSSRNAAV